MTYGASQLGGRKCGVAVSALDEGGGQPFSSAMLRIGAAHGLAWQTDWSSSYVQVGFTPVDYEQVRLVPQFWGKDAGTFEQVRLPLTSVILGFNEPDQAVMGGTGIEVMQALDLWMIQVQRAQLMGYTEFVAPSIAQSLPSRYTGLEEGGGSEWLPDFLQGCLTRPGCPESIDYLGFHLYEPNCVTDPDMVRQWSMNVRVGSMKKLRDEFNAKGMNIKGLWLTEFAGRSGEDGKCQTLQQQLGWMQVVVPMLNADPDVVAYSWFSYGAGRSPFFNDNANLWDYATGQLNQLGEAYFTLCSGHSWEAPAPTVQPSQPVWTAPPVPVPVPVNPGLSPAPWQKPVFTPAGPGPSVSPPGPADGAATGSSSGRSAVWLHVLSVVLLLGVAVGGTWSLFWYRRKLRTGQDIDLPPLLLDALAMLDSTVHSMCTIVKRIVRVDMAACSGGRVGCLAVCSDSGEDSIDSIGSLSPTETAAMEALRLQQPQLATAITASCKLLSDRRAFENECENVFQSLRRAVLQLPSPSSSSGFFGRSRLDTEGAMAFEGVPTKVPVWEFVLLFAEKRRFYEAQANEVCQRLELSPAWAQALARNPKLRQRRAALLRPSIADV